MSELIPFATIVARHEREKLALSLLEQLKYLGLASRFIREYRFDPDRRWRLDLFSGRDLLGVELHGGVFKGGRHTTGKGFTADREKMNAALEAGIRVLEYTTREVKSGTAALQIERIIKNIRRWNLQQKENDHDAG